MNSRYSRPEAAEIWSNNTKFSLWLEIETAAASAMENHNMIPKGLAKALKKPPEINIARISEIEKETRHDVIAFLTSISEQLGAESRYLHFGLTSSDIIDTAYNMQLRKAGNLIYDGLDRVLTALKTRSLQHIDTICVGRSHGVHAEPMSFSLKFASHYAAFERNQIRLKAAIKEISTCALSGAVGTFATIPPEIEAETAASLNLSPEPISTQIIPRDRHAHFFSTLAIIASSIEHLAIEIRHLQRTEVRELREGFAKGQKGSSAMPHKRNPILSENLTGLARIIRSTLTPALENIALWHERDISHSSVERIISPQATVTLDFALNRLESLINNLIIDPKAMQKNLDSLNGLVFSQRVLLTLTEKNISREEAYKTVQTAAMQSWETGQSFKELLLKDPLIIENLTKKDFARIFDYSPYLAHTKTILSRVFHEEI